LIEHSDASVEILSQSLRPRKRATLSVAPCYNIRGERRQSLVRARLPSFSLRSQMRLMIQPSGDAYSKGVKIAGGTMGALYLYKYLS
jgi:hypothetical protein